MKLMISFFVIVLMLGLFGPAPATAAFLVHQPAGDTSVTYAAPVTAAPMHPDRAWGQSNDRDNTGLLAAILALVGLFGMAATGIAIWLGVFVAVAAWVPIALFALFWAVGIAGFVLGWVALSKKPDDRRNAVTGILIGSLLINPLLTYVLTFVLNSGGGRRRSRYN